MLAHCERSCWIRLVVLLASLAGSATALAQTLIFVDGATCTLQKAIGIANYANGVNATSIGSATSDFTGCTTIPPPLPTYPTGPYTLFVTAPQITLTSIDNYWYGPNALPPIASAITIQGLGAGGYTQIVASHAGDPFPSTANAFRFFYVSGGLEIPAGSLVLEDVVLQGGYALGGASGIGGGGAGMGGAIFNQGSLALNHVTLLDNTARGGHATGFASGGGGGMGQDGSVSAGGGFGGSVGSGFGGTGSSGDATTASGGGGGGFIAGSNGGVGDTSGANGGGKGGLGGAGAPSNFYSGGFAGDGGGGGGGLDFGSGTTGSGGDFGMGGTASESNGGGNGGGVGGGGSVPPFGAQASGGGGFGGGGGGFFKGGRGGFGGGGGKGELPGFGGGQGNSTSWGGGGAGMGGAVFNHTGTVYFLDVTATGNAASGGNGVSNGNGDSSGLGAVLFNLNGSVTIDFSTLAGNSVSGNNGFAGNNGAEDASVYSIAYGNNIKTGLASAASLTIANSIVHGTSSDGGAGDDVLVDEIDGTQANASSVTYKGTNFVEFPASLGNVAQNGSPMQADPLLGEAKVYSGSTLQLPVIPIGANSPARDAAASCIEADGATPLSSDERGAARPNGSQCDVGAYEFDGDYIFASGFDAKL